MSFGDGYIYVVMNPSKVDVEVNIHTSEEDPVANLQADGISSSYALLYREFIDENLELVEKAVHELLIDYKVTNDSNAFFLEPYKAIEAIQEVKRNLLDGELGTVDTLAVSADGYVLFDEACNFYYGRGSIPQDYSKGLELFKKASEQGVLAAFTYLGRMYEHGNGVTPDSKKALAYYKAGAIKGSTICYAKMACLHWRDSEVRDIEKGKQYWHKYFTLLDHDRIVKEDYSNFNFYISLAQENQLEINYRETLGIYKEQMNKLLQIRKDVCYEQHSDNLPFREYMLDIINKEMNFVETLEQEALSEVKADYAIANDFLHITNMGIILLAEIERGAFQVGDEIQVNGPGTTSVTTEIKKIEKYGDFTKKTSAGENVGLLVKGSDEDFKFVKTGASIVKT